MMINCEQRTTAIRAIEMYAKKLTNLFDFLNPNFINFYNKLN